MSITLYRRHGEGCSVHASGLPARAKRCWNGCECPIWLYGSTPKGIYNRQSTGLRDWSAALALVRSLQAEAADEQAKGPLLRECVERWLGSIEGECAERTFAAQKLTLGKLQGFCEGRGLLFLRDLNADIMEDFKSFGLASLHSSQGRSNAVGRCKQFLREAHRRGWLAEDLAAKVRRPKVTHEQKKPFTEAEVAALLDGCGRLRKGNRQGFAAEPATFRLLLELMLETGMRVSDAVRFDPSKLERGERSWAYVFVPKKLERKSGSRCEVFLSDRLKRAIDGCRWLSEARPFAYRWRDEYHMGMQVWQVMRSVGRLAGVADCRPHRLRDTFAVRCLLRGLQLEDLARLLGHSSLLTTERFYAAWVPARRARLEALVDAMRDRDGDGQGDAPAGAAQPQTAQLGREKAADGVGRQTPERG